MQQFFDLGLHAHAQCGVFVDDLYKQNNIIMVKFGNTDKQIHYLIESTEDPTNTQQESRALDEAICQTWDTTSVEVIAP